MLGKSKIKAMLLLCFSALLVISNVGLKLYPKIPFQCAMEASNVITLLKIWNVKLLTAVPIMRLGAGPSQREQ